MSLDFLDPWEKLVKLIVLGKVLEVPEKNNLLRQFQYVAPDVASGKYCWNGECRYCEVQYLRPGASAPQSVMACLVNGTEGMRIVKLAPEVRYNLSEALSKAPKAEE